MIAFIDHHRDAHGVEPICRVLPIALSTYHARAARRAETGKASPHARRDIVLRQHIRRVRKKMWWHPHTGEPGCHNGVRRRDGRDPTIRNPP